MKPKKWRVRVRRAVEDWVEVTATDRKTAEEAAVAVPGVLSVFGGSGVPADIIARPDMPAIGVEEER